MTDNVSQAPASRAAGLFIWLNAIGATILIGTELLLVSASLDWAISGMMHLQRMTALVLLGVMLAASAWACWIFLRSTLRAERRLAAGTFDAR